LMRNTIMTEKIARRGVRVLAEYSTDFLDQVLVKDAATRDVVALAADDTLGDVRAWFASQVPGTEHQGFPVLDRDGLLAGVVTRREIFDASEPESTPLLQTLKNPPAIVFEDNSLREAADHMLNENVGRLAVVARSSPRKVVGWITRSNLLTAHRQRLADSSISNREIDIRPIRLNRSSET